MTVSVKHAHQSAIADDGSDVGSNAWNAEHDVSGLSSPSIGDEIIGGSSGSILFVDTTGKLAQDAGLAYDLTTPGLEILTVRAITVAGANTGFISNIDVGTPDDTFYVMALAGGNNPNSPMQAGDNLGALTAGDAITRASIYNGITLDTRYSNTSFHNFGFGMASSITLPTATVYSGQMFTFIVDEAQTFTIHAQAGETINVGASQTIAGGNISSNAVGSVITLENVNTSVNGWMARSVVGTWAVN